MVPSNKIIQFELKLEKRIVIHLVNVPHYILENGRTMCTALYCNLHCNRRQVILLK